MATIYHMYNYAAGENIDEFGKLMPILYDHYSHALMIAYDHSRSNMVTHNHS